MATLTPGVLLKLLQSMNSDSKITGEHRSSVLQVIGIVPVPGGADDLWPARGFYLQLSDSLNSTYVSLSDPDADAILSSRSQLGQLVHVARLYPAHPVPRASGVRIIPPGRPLPFAGRPEPLLALSDPSRPDGFLIQPAPDSAPPAPAPFDEKPATRTVFAARENVTVMPPVSGTAASKRRFSSPAAAKSTRKSGAEAEHRNPSPAPSAAKANSRPSSPALGRAGSRSSSPVPSKCEVPSLVAAKEENRRVAKEPAIIVPSRFRQPSPVGRKGAASPAGRRSSMSPGRRLSGGLKVSPALGDSKKKMVTVVAGISKVSDALVGSMRATRKSWEDQSSKSTESSETKEKTSSKSKVDNRAIIRTQAAISRRLSDVGGENSNGDETSNEKPRPSNKIDCPSMPDKLHRAAPNFVIHDKKWTDGSIPIDALSDNLARLGKEVVQSRSIASKAAAEALEEALATESIIRNLSMFADLCSSSKSANPLPTISRFLSIHDDVLKCNTNIESLIASRTNGVTSDNTFSRERRKSVLLWVEAALTTDLGVLSLLNTGDRRKSLEKSESPPAMTCLSKRKSFTVPSKTNNGKPSVSASTSSSVPMWSGGCGIVQALDLAQTLRHEMQTWFLKFVEESLDVGFRLLAENSDDEKDRSSCRDKGQITAVLSHLKRVNEWLDAVGKGPEEESLKDVIERLKRKIYGFVITHVGSAFDSLSLSKA
ncbi:uncharacterized protein LOC120283477 [Dioscorea cayenensis subsp. rotundata]|uniref:Uncharacterized protein LOC120283477 n=1 Tax=Dioscorea cayennensis subsp. rotundata TaxID=55577 RepID=A0AB40D5L6_DIOCR|nr:uncharacterized protein LOC120283477 [Dioscorea cayenensis subsp. rotundata]